MKRRDFVQQTALTGTILLIQPSSMFKPNDKHIGVQLWSVRDVADKDPKVTFEKLVRMGYTEVEGHRYDNGLFYTYSPLAFAKLLKDVDLKMTSAHTGISVKHWDSSNRTINDLAKKIIDDHAEIGVKQLICPSIDEDWRTADHLKQLCDVFNHFGEACKKSGIQFGYHNHDADFNKAENKYIIDLILQQTDPALVIWEMDLYWVKYANEDPAKWINQYGERIHAFHVKDMANTTRRESIEVGEGTIDFETLFRLPGASKVTYYIVELEDYRTTSMEGVDISLQHLKKILTKI